MQAKGLKHSPERPPGRRRLCALSPSSTTTTTPTTIATTIFTPSHKSFKPTRQQINQPVANVLSARQLPRSKPINRIGLCKAQGAMLPVASSVLFLFGLLCLAILPAIGGSANQLTHTSNSSTPVRHPTQLSDAASDDLRNQHPHLHQHQQNHHHALPSIGQFVRLSINNSSTISRTSNLNGHTRGSGAGDAHFPFASQNDSQHNHNYNHHHQHHHRSRDLFEKICIGTTSRMSSPSNKTDHYQNLVERYKNCTYVIGNLEITWLGKSGLSDEPLDLSFLESIREITGYLLIAYVEVDRIRMPNLQIIRGRDLFKLNSAPKEEYAIYVIENAFKSLELPNLREILAGDAGFHNNRNLCYINSLVWDEILNSGFKTKYFIDTKQYGQPEECPKCHNSCSQGSCWGPGPEMCQKFSKTSCSPQCEKGRCFGQLPRECCHLFCAGGCTGPKQTDCFACKHFYNDGECIQECPPMRKYNPSKFLWENDPNGKYAFGATCVKECPDHLLRDNGACVRSCPPDKRSLNGECIACTGPCPKNCQGVDVVHSGNIDQLINCTEIEGSITILDTSFTGFTDVLYNNTMGTRYEPMHPSKLKVFETIRTITGYLNIQAAHPDFTNLSFFSKLETIGGRQTTDMFQTLTIIKTSLVSLNLRSLKRVRAGKIVIEENKDLCFINATQFSRIEVSKEQSPSEAITIRNNGYDSLCSSMNLKCHAQCSAAGCWGPGQDECLSCTNYKLDDYCVRDCASTRHIGILSYDTGNRTCSKCHPECKFGCNGAREDNCWQCKNFKDGPYCLHDCPKHKYNNNGTCQECHSVCTEGCTGPSDVFGEFGCKSCGKFVIESLSPVPSVRCIKAEERCPEGYYQEYGAQVNDSHPLKALERKPVCRRCHPRCKSCNGYGTHKDVCECAGYVANDQCENSCSRDSYADEKTRRCVPCSRECNGCHGPTDNDCINCRVYRLYLDSPTGPVASARVIGGGGGNSGELSSGSITKLTGSTGGQMEGVSPKQQGKFKCTSQCPPEKPHRISESNLLDPYCSEDPGPDLDNPRIVSLGSTSFLFMLIILCAVIFCIFMYKYKLNDDKTVKLTMRLSGFDDVEPLNQSNLRPNLAPLRSIKETELRKGSILGSGFGGKVYQGFWFPEGQENKEPRPVAIKVLHDNGSSNMNKEFLDEAYIMASVNHPNLVRLLAVCMTRTELMLVTHMMPLGCLLDYVKSHQREIGPKNLLEWGKQIAKGMAYLEEQRMVHRDLALRNVLLQNSNRALISDFGLAKFLDVDQSEYHSGGGRLPIKWLAPECIRERKFTHKSDVWAFGVTIWELLTFGRRPFEEYDTKEVPTAIERGARLEQPSYVSAEVYKVMYACWFYNPDKRPDFKSLVQNFGTFASDPERYLDCDANGLCKVPLRSSDSDEELIDSDSLDNDNEDDDDDDNENANNNNNATNQHLHNDIYPPRSIGAGVGGPVDLFGQQQQQQQQQQPLMAQGDVLELRNHNSESDTPIFSPLTPTFKKAGMFQSNGRHLMMNEDVFSHSSHTQLLSSNMAITDPNNNANFSASNNTSSNRMNGDSCLTFHQSVSTASLEQPTDSDNYLLPSPCSNEVRFNKIYASQEGRKLQQQHHQRRMPPAPPFSSVGDPPHSAGLIGVTNYEYFATGNSSSNYNASSSHIPTSLV